MDPLPIIFRKTSLDFQTVCTSVCDAQSFVQISTIFSCRAEKTSRIDETKKERNY